MSNGYISQIEVVPAMNGGDIGILFSIASEVVNPFSGTSVQTHRAGLDSDEITEEVMEAARVLFNACASAVDSKLPVIDGVKAAMQVTNFDDTVLNLKAKRNPRGE